MCADKVLPYKVVSGAQSGSDRAGLDAALAMNIEIGGWCPKGRRAEDGPIPARYPLTETSSARYEDRTLLNIEDSDGTVIFTRGPVDGGSALTQNSLVEQAKPFLHIDLDGFSKESATTAVAQFIRSANIKTLNVAGNRESKSPGIAQDVKEILMLAFLQLRKEEKSGSSLRVRGDTGSGTATQGTGPAFRRK